MQEIADRAITTVTGDAGYAYAKVYGALERRGIDPLIPAKKEPIKSRVPTRRFRYDARHDIVKCPRGKVLRPGTGAQVRALLPLQIQGLRALYAQGRLPVQGTRQQVGGDRR